MERDSWIRLSFMTQDNLEFAATLHKKIHSALETVIKGKPAFLTRLITAIVTGGHVLVEDVPGLGKTTAAKALARILHLERGGFVFRRIQFTPDLLPYDITGVDVFNPETRGFEFKAGPVFANILLADEINRTTPKVQSALLEVMEENQVTVGLTTHTLGPLFFVVATQNPIEMEGTYPLPAAQLDRFLMKLRIGYPSEEQERQIYTQDPSHRILPTLTPQVAVEDLLRVRVLSEEVHAASEIMDLLFGLVKATRDHKALSLGVSPRGGVMFLKALKVYALLSGRDYVVDQDVTELAVEVLAHRVHMKNPKLNAESVIKEILSHELAKNQK